MPQINIVIPSYNEYENLEILVPQIISVLDKSEISYKILLIDRKLSTDCTPKLEKQYPLRVKVINRKPADTYGDAVRTGIEHCDGDYIVFMDADGSHDPEFILKLIEQKHNADFVIASRYVAGGGSFNGPVLKFMSMMVNLSYRVILNIPAKDVSNSFKLYKASIIKPLNLKCSNFDIIEEVFFKAVKLNKNLKVIELPYFFKERLYGKTKRDLVSFSFSFLATLLRLRFS